MNPKGNVYNVKQPALVIFSKFCAGFKSCIVGYTMQQPFPTVAHLYLYSNFKLIYQGFCISC